MPTLLSRLCLPDTLKTQQKHLVVDVEDVFNKMFFFNSPVLSWTDNGRYLTIGDENV
jgi:hypothetical protein